MRDLTLAGVAEAVSKQSGAKCTPMPEHAVSGGSINTCYQWRSARGLLFVKVAGPHEQTMLEAEADGLRELAAANAVRVPTVLASGATSRAAFLALEWIEPRPPHVAEALLGEQLAFQHHVTAPEFGWHRDNTIGRTPQINSRRHDWMEFFREQRLRYQLELATRNGYGAQLEAPGLRLLEHLGAFFATYSPAPSLLHGDLWGGNWFADPADRPVIFDPATYYGDREADIAMTHLFGGFGRKFYEAYEAAWPLDAGHATRRDLYNLYHVLNHANLFGGGYAHQARGLIDQLLAEVC